MYNVGAPNFQDDNTKKPLVLKKHTKSATEATEVKTEPPAAAEDETTSADQTTIQLVDNQEGIPVDSFEYRVKKIIIKKGLDKNNDDVIDDSEAQAIKDYFEVNDIKKLLKKPDTEAPQPTDSDATQPIGSDDAQTDDTDTDLKQDEFAQLMDSNNAILRNDGSAAYELQQKVAGDLTMSSASGTPFAAQMDNLNQTRKNLMNKHRDTSDIDAKIDALNEAAREYVKTNQTEVTQTLIDQGVVKTFKYGENGEKTGYFIQTLDFKGGNTMSKDDDTATSEVSTDGTDGTTDGNQGSDNGAGVNVKYGIEVLTDKLHAVANVEAGSENSDLQGAVVYTNPLKNGGKLSFTGNFRQTIEKNNNETKFGGALDYTRNSFSTGAYASYESSEVDSETYKDFNIEAYTKFGKSVRFALGHETETSSGEKVGYNYALAKLEGSRNFNNDDLTLIGSLEGRYGIANIDGENYTDYNIKAKGGVSFKSNNLKANILANLGLNGGTNYITKKTDNTLFGTLVGNIITDKVDVTATLSGMQSHVYDITLPESVDINNVDLSNISNIEGVEFNSATQTGWSSSITITPKGLFGKKTPLTPSITYSVTNTDELDHYIGVNLGLHF